MNSRDAHMADVNFGMIQPAKLEKQSLQKGLVENLRYNSQLRRNSEMLEKATVYSCHPQFFLIPIRD